MSVEDQVSECDRRDLQLRTPENGLLPVCQTDNELPAEIHPFLGYNDTDLGRKLAYDLAHDFNAITNFEA